MSCRKREEKEKRKRGQATFWIDGIADLCRRPQEGCEDKVACPLSPPSQNATGKDILEGNAGSDILWGGPDDDKVFGHDYGEMETLIAEGETAQGISERGDLVSGAWGNDFIYGSNASDLLFGSEGHDLIVGGAGDDAILGDDEFTYAVRDWSFAVLADGSNVWAHALWTDGIDRLEGWVYGDDVIYAGAGNDFVHAGGRRVKAKRSGKSSLSSCPLSYFSLFPF